MYTDIDFKTKTDLKYAVSQGKRITVYQPGGIFPSKTDGNVTIEGPHGVHKWYAQAVIKDGCIVCGSVK